MKVRNGTERVRVRGRRVQSGELCRSASRTMRYVRARSGSELLSGATESVRNDDVSGISKAAAREIRGRNHARYMHGRDTNMRQCDKVLAVDALGGISVAVIWVRVRGRT